MLGFFSRYGEWGLLEWGLLPNCGMRASRCRGFSCCGTQAVGLSGSGVVAPGLKGVTDSVVVAHGLSYPEACGIFLDQELNPCKSLHCMGLHCKLNPCIGRQTFHQGSPLITFKLDWTSAKSGIR